MPKIVEHGHELLVSVGGGSQTLLMVHTHRVQKPDHKHPVACEPAHMRVPAATRPMDEEDLGGG